MSSSTWTPAALASSARPLRQRCWRVVEAQSRASTMKLTDTLEEQAELETLIEESKASIPEECRGLHYLLSTPFRYVPYRFNSRFRRAGSPDGVFYASEASETAMAEAAFYRLLFYIESPATPWPANPAEHTAFAADIRAAKAIDLTRPPLAADRALWTHLTDYDACLDLADTAREAAVDAIRYQSVRDAKARANIAVLTCTAFARKNVTGWQTWHLHFGASGVRAVCEAPAVTIQFDREAFAADPRLAGMAWDR